MKLVAILTVCCLVLSVFPPVLARGGDIDLTIEAGVLSARLKEIPLRIILEKLERERGIWFRGDSSLLEKEITVQFAELPFEDGLKRILAFTNHSIMSDGNGKLVGVIIIGKSAANHGVPESRRSAQKRPVALPGTNEQGDFNRSVTRTGDSPPRAISEGRKDFGAIKSSPPPGGPIEGTGKERENFMVIENFPPPGGPVESTEQEPENFRVIRNTPPPGGPVEVSPEKLENFKVIKNCPPPGN